MTPNRSMDRALAAVETPAAVVDRAVLARNIARAAAIARKAGAALRPHAKTHKSLAIARQQMAAGAVGLTVAKTSEAVVFLDGGIGDVTVAHPLVDGRKIARLLDAARRAGGRVSMIADSTAGLEAIAAAAAAAQETARVFIKVDVGLHRCGVDPGTDAAMVLARAIARQPALRFAGLLSHAGHAYSAQDADGVRAAADAERQTMAALAARLAAAGLAPPALSAGSTPTVWCGTDFAGMTELRPGNYVFMDLTQISLGVAAREDIALSVIATVVSCNDRFAIVDAGSKVLSSDRGPHGSTRLAGYGIALPLGGGAEMTVASLSEEHGFLAHGGVRPAIGSRVRILPNHACTVANLARRLIAVDEAGGIEEWPVEAGGCVL